MDGPNTPCIVVNEHAAIIEYLRKASPLAFMIWDWASNKPNGWKFRQNDILSSFDVSRYKYEKAAKVLRQLGLIKTISIHDPITNCIDQSFIIFFTSQQPYRLKNEINFTKFISLTNTTINSIGCDESLNVEHETFENSNDSNVILHHPKNPLESPSAKKSSIIDSPVLDCKKDISSSEDYGEAIPYYKCGDSPIEQRLAFSDQFDGSMIWQTFDDSDAKRSSLVSVMSGDLWDVQDDLESLNNNGAGVFVAVNEMTGMKRSNADTKRVRYLVADFDGIDPRPAFADKPHMIVESSRNKFHCYWRIDGCPNDAYRGIQTAIIHKYGCDAAVKDLARVLRVPGFTHCKIKKGVKSEPFMTRLRYVGRHPALSFSDAVVLFPPKKVKQWTAPKYRDPQTGEFKGQYGTGEGGRNNHVASRIGGMIKAGKDWAYIEQEAMKEGYACNPPLSDAEIKSVVESMRRY